MMRQVMGLGMVLVMATAAGAQAVSKDAQVAQAVPCTRFHSLPSRLALWLLRAQDRLGVSELRFTHLRLAGLLGVQRSAVTIAAGHLHRAGVIRYARGELRILDRDRLEAAACDCYAAGRRQRPRAMP